MPVLTLEINKETENLLKDPAAFFMLANIAFNTKRDDSFSIPDLEIGQAFMTGCQGMSTSEYRKTKIKLAKWGFVKFNTTNQGTIAQITTDKFFKYEDN